MKRRRRQECRRVVLYRAATEPEAELWAGACKSVLRDLEVALWWRVGISQVGGDGWLVAVDYTPAGQR